MDIPRKCAALSLLIASACHTAESPPPSTEQACTRVGEREARSFTGLQPMGTIGTSKLYGRPKQMLCSEPGPGGRGECEIVGASEIRIEFPAGASGFRTSGREPVIFTYDAAGNFSCRGAKDAP